MTIFAKALMRRFALPAFMLCAHACFAQPGTVQSATQCGEVITVNTHNGSTTRYSLASAPAASSTPTAVVLLAGGAGYLNLDDKGCARLLRGNWLVRSAPLFRNAGFFTAIVDAPSTHHGEDGLAGFRVDAQHAEDLGKVIADVRARTKGTVWLVSTSRGAISAANAVSRLTGAFAPDGVVFSSPVTSGQAGARKPWVAHSVFDLKLEAVTIPVLAVGHAADRCVRSPAIRMADITARTSSAREQVMTVTGGPGNSPQESSIDACEGRSPHGFIGQESDVVSGIARFIAGGSY